jgi:hypothetical protein
MTTLAFYEGAVADLLHDPNNNNWSVSQLDNYINEARRQVVMDTGTLRTLQASYITQGQEQYTFGQVCGAAIVSGGHSYTAPTITFSGGGGTGVAATLGVSGGAVNTINFTNFGSGYTSAPGYVINDSTGSGASIALGIMSVYTYDVLTVNVQWGQERYPLGWRPWSDFSRIFRTYTAATMQRQPECWAAYSDTSIFIGCPPDQTYPVEFDTIILPAPIAVGDYTTQDPIPMKVQDPIKFYAAALAKDNIQSFGEAETFRKRYRTRMLEVATAYTRRIPG